MTTPFGLDIVNQAPKVSSEEFKTSTTQPANSIRQGTKLWVRYTRLDQKDIKVVSHTLTCTWLTAAPLRQPRSRRKTPATSLTPQQLTS
jgi:hypothetical protein